MKSDLFDKSAEYDAMLHEGLKLSGEDKYYFLEGRVTDMVRHLPKGLSPKRILDFGCGLGETCKALSRHFPQAQIVGVDSSENALAWAAKHHGSPLLSFKTLAEFNFKNEFDLCYVNGVFHHISPNSRLDALWKIHDSLKSGGCLALFENNPWNPGTKLVMSRIAFDNDAQTFSAAKAQALLRSSGFAKQLPPRFLFYFPRILGFLRGLEPLLVSVPLGAQYYVVGIKE